MRNNPYNQDETPFVFAASNFALSQLCKGIKPKAKEPIIDWLTNHVDMSYDATTAVNGYYKPYPYQIAPLKAQEDPNVHRITLMMGQRLGKSTIWRMGLLKRVADGNCSCIVAYPNLELGLKQNADSVKPLLTMLPEVKRDFSMRGNVKIDSYHSPSTSSVIYFMGAGSPLLSVTASYLIADEVDFMELPQAGEEGKNTSQLKNLWLRGQTFPNRLMIVVSSPTQYGGAVYQDWLKGSREVWHLRCCHCGNLIAGNRLAFRIDGKAEWAGLQWRKNESGQVIEESIRYICPICGHSHTQADAYDLADNGDYVGEVQNVSHRSFQAGALANPRLWNWLEIANWQESATDGDGRKFLHNSVLGMPYKHTREGDAVSMSIEQANKARQIEYPADLGSKIEIVVAGIDQQRNELAGRKYFVVVIRGWDKDGNSWLLHESIADTLADLENKLKSIYYGQKVTLALIDQGGFSNVDDLDPFVESHANCYYYKGAALKDEKGNAVDFTPSKTQRKLFMANAIGWQVKLLDLLYSPKRPKGYNFWLPLKLSTEYLQQLCNVRPNSRMQKDSAGQEYANWYANDRRDFFDAEKMALCALYIAAQYLPPHCYRAGHIPLFIAREKILELARLKKSGKA